MYWTVTLPKIAFRRMWHVPGTMKHFRLAALGSLAFLVTSMTGNAQTLPAAVSTCKMSGYSINKGRIGAAVRSEPTTVSKILGRLAPPQKATGDDNYELAVADGLWRTEFQIIGYKEGWLLIERALHPYDDADRRSVLGRRSTGGVRTYTGRGWISLNDVGGKLTYFHRSMPDGSFYSEPRADATRLPAKNALGQAIRGGNSPKKVLGCDGEWVKVESDDGGTGWWKGLCGEPIGDCGKD